MTLFVSPREMTCIARCREGLISRQEALHRLEKENRGSIAAVNELLEMYAVEVKEPFILRRSPRY